MNKKGPKIDNYRKMRKKGNFHIFQKTSKNEKFAKMKTKFKKNNKKRRKKKRKKRKGSTQKSLTSQNSECQNIHVMLSYAKIGNNQKTKPKITDVVENTMSKMIFWLDVT